MVLFSLFPIFIFFAALTMSIRGALGPDPISEELGKASAEDRTMRLQVTYLLGTLIACAATVSYLAIPSIPHPWEYMMFIAFIVSFASLIKQVFHPDLYVKKDISETTASGSLESIAVESDPENIKTVHKKSVLISESVRRLYAEDEPTDEKKLIPAPTETEEVLT